jgi:signal transduction histidine kinase
MTGSFDVTSAVGEGTTVEFQLPLPDVTSDPVSKRRGPTRA